MTNRQRAAALVLAVGLLASGCAGTDPAVPPEVIPDAELTQSQRAIKASATAVIGVELAADRVLFESPTDADTTVMFILRVRQSIADIKTAGGLWLHADLFDATRGFARSFGDRAKGRLTRILALFRGGISVRDGIELFGRVAKGAEMLRDVRAMMAGLRGGTITEFEAWAAIDGRIGRNLQRLGPLSIVPASAMAVTPGG